MQKKIYLFISVLIISASLLTAFGGGDNDNPTNPSGAPAGNTGSPGDGQNCARSGCHSGSATFQAGIITSNVPAQGYTPGSSYTMTVTLSGSGRKGFEVSPQSITGTLLGTLTAGTGTKLVGSGKYVTQSSGVSTATATWNFTWTAPAAGTGAVTFYGAFAITTSTTKLSTLVVNENLATPLSVTATATPSTLLSGNISQLNSIPAGGSGSYTYSWVSNPGGFTSTQQNPGVSPTVTTQYTVTVNDGAGNASNSTTVTVIPNNLLVTANATPTTILSGNSSQLNATPSGGSGSYTYSWVSNPGGFTSTQQNPSVSPIVNTQYTVTLNDGYSSANNSVSVTVIANTLSVTASATPSTILSGNSSQLNATPSGGSGSYTYSWGSNPGGFTSTQQNPSVSPTVTTQYTVTVNDGVANASNSTTVTVIPNNLLVTASATPTTLLSGNSSQLNATPSGGSGSYTYSWVSNPGGFTSTQQNPSVSPTINTQYTVTLNDGYSSANNFATVAVIPNNLLVTASANPTTITAGQSSQLSSGATGGSGSYTYSWTSLPAGFTSTLQNPLVSPNVSTQYTVQVNDGYQTNSNSATVTVTGGVLSIDATATPGTVCSGQSSQLNVLITGGSGAFTFSWTSVPVGFTSTVQNPLVSPVQNTKYFVQVNDGSQTKTDSIQINVTFPPTAAAGADTSYCDSVTEITLHGTATGYSNLLWTTNGDGTFSNSTTLNSIYFPGSGDKGNGSVHLTLTASPISPCNSASSGTRVILFMSCPVGIPGLPVNVFTFSIRPNPSSGIFTIYSPNVKNEDVLIRVIDLSGKIVLIENFSIPGDKLDHRIDLSSLTKGIYFVRIETNNGVKTEKMILQ